MAWRGWRGLFGLASWGIGRGRGKGLTKNTTLDLVSNIGVEVKENSNSGPVSYIYWGIGRRNIISAGPLRATRLRRRRFTFPTGPEVYKAVGPYALTGP